MKLLMPCLLTILFLNAPAMAQVPRLLSHQGYIADSTGVGISGSLPMVFRLFDDSIGGAIILTQSFPGITFVKGVFNVNIDVSSASFNGHYWLETEVNNQTLLPRTLLTSVPYALISDTAMFARSAGRIRSTFSVGLDSTLGGFIFYVTPDEHHGLVAATQDQGLGSWFGAKDITSNPDNHDAIGKNFTDWRLPTKYELGLIYLLKSSIGGFGDAYYWSSTEDDEGSLVWIQHFADGFQDTTNKNSPQSIRAVRSF